MTRSLAVTAIAAAALGATTLQAQNAEVAHQQEFLEANCVECHNFEDWAGKLDLESVNLADPVADAAT